MRIAVLGTGMVGDTITSKLVKVGHRIMGGSRTADSDAGQAWLRRVGGQGQIGTFAAAAAFGEIVFDCTNGAHTLAALRQAGVANPRGKILIQVGSNPLDTYHRCLNRQSVAKRSNNEEDGDEGSLESNDARGRDVHSRAGRVRSEPRLRTASVTPRAVGRPCLGAEGNSECGPRRAGTARRLMAR
jgi:NADP oxidoreductase coenzyme F420-dependent